MYVLWSFVVMFFNNWGDEVEVLYGARRGEKVRLPFLLRKPEGKRTS
jgi:hypothetical protein